MISDTFLLTDNQKAILQALANGESQKEYAARTFRSYSTVKHTLQLVLEELDAKNVLQAVTIALRKGLIQ